MTPARLAPFNRLDLLEGHGPPFVGPDPKRGIEDPPWLIIKAKDRSSDKLCIAVAIDQTHLRLRSQGLHLTKNGGAALCQRLIGRTEPGGPQQNNACMHCANHLLSSTGTSLSSRSTSTSASRLSARAWKLSTRRCRKTGAAIAWMSAKSTWYL